MKENKYYTVKSIEEFEFSEIDFDLYNEMHPNADIDEDGDGWYQEIGQYNEGYPIQIDRMIEKLQEFKNNGANYVSLSYHCDHIGYCLESLVIHPSTLEEIKGEEDKVKKAKEKDKKATKLRKELNDLYK